MTLVGFIILVIIAALVITQPNKSLPPSVEEPIEETVLPEKPSLALVVFWLFISMATVAIGLYGIWLNV